MKFLLDTNICIYYLKGKYDLHDKFNSINPDFLFISEITLAELKFGVANSKAVEKNQLALSKLLSGLQVLPIFDSIDMYASEKARLRKLGTPTDDFDLLIGATAVNHGMILVTNNTKHFEKIKGIRLENWVESV